MTNDTLRLPLRHAFPLHFHPSGRSALSVPIRWAPHWPTTIVAVAQLILFRSLILAKVSATSPSRAPRSTRGHALVAFGAGVGFGAAGADAGAGAGFVVVVCAGDVVVCVVFGAADAVVCADCVVVCVAGGGETTVVVVMVAWSLLPQLLRAKPATTRSAAKPPVEIDMAEM